MQFLTSSQGLTAQEIYDLFVNGTNADAFKEKNTELEIHSALDNYANKTDYKADVSSLALETSVQAIDTDELPTLAEMEASSVLTATADISTLETKAQADARQALLIAEHDQTQVDISNISFSDTAILAAISSLNNISTADVRAELSTELSRLDVNVSSIAYNDTALTALVNALPTLAQMEASSALTAIADITGLSTHDATAVVTAMQVVADDFKADVSGINFDDTAILNAISSLNDLSVADVEGSNLSKEATLTSIISSIADIPTTDNVADLTPVITAINGLNDPTVSEIVTGLQAVADDFKADLTGVAYDDTLLISKIDFIDSIVDTILLDTDELQTNQGNFATATGFATPTDVTNSETAIIAEIDENEAKIDLISTSSGGYDDTVLISKVDAIDLNVDSIKSITDNLVNTDLTSVLNAIAALNDIDLATIEGSSILSKEASLTIIATSISAIPTTDNVADLTPVLTAISNLNNSTPAEVRAAFNAVDFKDKNTEAEIHAFLDSYNGKDSFKSDVSDLAKESSVQLSIAVSV